MEEGSFGRRQQSSAALDLRRAPLLWQSNGPCVVLRVGRQTRRTRARCGREGGPEAIKLKSAHGSAHETTSARSARYINYYVAA